MSDLISRKAAIDAMDTWDKFGCDPNGMLVRYDDDKHYVPYVHYDDMVHVIKSLPSTDPRWIPVTERLPEKTGYYLTSTEYNDVLSDFFCAGKWKTAERFWYNVTAWMPLPEAYEGEKK